MAKEVWRLENFSGGLNNNSDPKDLDADELAEAINLDLNKFGQIKGSGSAIRNKDVDNNIPGNTIAGELISGEGLGYLRSDNSWQGLVSDENLQFTLTEHAIATNGEKASARFTIEDLVVMMSGDPGSTGRLRFRLKLGASEYLMPDDAGSRIIDFSSADDTDSDQEAGDIFDNSLYDADGSDFDIYYDGGGPIFAKNTISWYVSQNDSTIFNDTQFFGAGNESRRCIGFFEILIQDKPGDNWNFALPWYNYNDNDNFDISNQNYLAYTHSKYSFAQWLVKEINDYTSTSGWTAELTQESLLGNQTNDLGNPLYNAGYEIRLTKNVVGTSDNNKAIRPHVTVSTTLGNSVTLIDDLYDSSDFTNSKIVPGQMENLGTIWRNGFVSEAGDNCLLRIAGDKTTSGGVNAITGVWKLAFDGGLDVAGRVNIKITRNSDGSEWSRSFLTDNFATIEDVVDNLRALINTQFSGYITCTEENSGKTLVLTADAAGQSAGFKVSFYIDFQSAAYNTSAADEQVLLISEAVSTSDTTVEGGGTIKKLDLDVYSKDISSWVDKFNGEHINVNKGQNFDWVYGSENNYKSKPVFYNEAGIMRMIEGNFLLPNKNKYYGFIDNTSFFKNSEGEQQFQFMESENLLGFFCDDNSKEWKYTNGDSNYGDNKDNLGVQKNAYTDTISSMEWSADEAMVRIEFDVVDTDSGLDWDESDIKIYASAMYKDGSESLPGHAFQSSGSSHIFDMGTEGQFRHLQAQIYMRPENSAGELCFPDRRIKGLHLYFTDLKDDHEIFWDLGIIDFQVGFIKGGEITTLDSTEGNTATYEWKSLTQGSDIVQLHNGTTDIISWYAAPKLKEYVDFAGYNPYDVSTTSNIRYKTACIGGRRAFIGNIEVTEGNAKTRYNDRMVYSPVNSLDVFPYPQNVLDLDISDGDEIVALFSIGDKIFQFKTNVLYVIDISSGTPDQFFVESRNKFKGITSKNHSIEVDGGVFWFNKNSAYMYREGEDSSEITDLLETSVGEENTKLRINKTDWKNHVSDASICGYNPENKEIFVIKSSTGASINSGNAYVYNIRGDFWTFGKRIFYNGTNKNMTNIINFGSNGTLTYLAKGDEGLDDESLGNEPQ